MRHIRPAAVLTALLLPGVLFAVPPTQGAPAEPDARADSGWAKLNTGTIINIARTDMLRTADGLLHVVYPQEVGVTDSYEHTTVSTTGAVVGHSTAVAGWGALTNDPVLLPTATGGMQIVYGGLQDTDVNNPYSAGHLYRAVSDGTGAAWAVQPEALTKSGYGYASYGTGAALLPDGTSIQGYPLNSDFTFRVGTTPLPTSEATPADQVASVPGGSLLHTTLVQSGGNVWAAWYDQDNNGVFVRQVHPAVGPVVKAPGQSADTLNPGQAVPMVVRPDGSIVIAYCLGYPTCSSIGLWQLGTTTVHKVPGSKAANNITMDTGPTGRLWVAWSNDSEILATRSSTSGFSFGALRHAGKPSKDDAIYGLQVEASRGEASVVANNAVGIYHRQLQPGLALKANPMKWDGDKKKEVTFVVTDAAVPLAGVKVKGGGEKCTTNAQGKCSVTYAAQKPGKIKVTASLTGFSDAVTKLKVKP